VKVAEIMRTPVLTVDADAPLADAVVTLAATAESDPERRAEVLETPVRMLMTPRTLTIAPGAGVREAARRLLYADVHRIFVTDQDRVVGVVSSSDVVRAIAAGAGCREEVR